MLGSAELVIINRTLGKAEHLAAATGGRALPLRDLELALSQADAGHLVHRRSWPRDYGRDPVGCR